MRSIARLLLTGSLLGAIAPLLALLGCGGSGSSGTGTPVMSTVQRDTAPDVPAGDESELVTGNTDFAFALYPGFNTASGSATSNLFYSPYSVSLALAMTYAGANGATATQMAHALDFTLPESKLNPAFDKLDLAIEATPAGATGADGGAFAIKLADSLWGDESVSFGQTFVNTLAADYGAGLRTVDFVHQPSQAEAEINQWVASETDNKINPLLGPGVVNSGTALVLVNAVYFNAAWQSQFDPSTTATGTFTRTDGTTVRASMMSSSEVGTAYFKGSNYEAVELPYSGNTTSMVVVLPDEGQYAAVEKGLTGSFYADVTGGLLFAEGTLTLPRFKIDGGSVNLVPTLKSLGMTDAFNPDKADFTKMIPAGGDYITFVIHQAFVDVDESGTEAAAATAVGVGTLAASTNTFSVTLNRPFFFFIRDLASNTVLFVGRESDPTAM
jgi:serpin B